MKNNRQLSHRNLGPIVIPKTTDRDENRLLGNAERDRDKPCDAYRSFGGIQSDRRSLSAGTLRNLSRLIQAPIVDSTGLKNYLNSPTPGPGGRPGIPAGYTYLFQLVAHDLVNTIVPSTAATAQQYAPRNGRKRALMLETVFGDGPLVCPFAYDVKEELSRLRTGFVRVRDSKGWARSKPARDLPRTTFCTSGNYAPKKNGLETVLIPDSRNDDNILLAQMTVLFHGIYNYFVNELSRQKALANAEIGETARQLLVRVYRRIVRNDLSARILHPDVYRLYDAIGALGLDQTSKCGSASIEFAFAAGRLGHSMVREIYSFNKGVSPNLRKIIRTSSRHKPKSLPVRRSYLVEWDRFFPSEDGSVPSEFNWANRFGAHVANHLKIEDAASTPMSGTDGDIEVYGTTFRDLMRENSWPMSTVCQLVHQFATHPPFNGWGTILDAVLGKEDRQKIVDLGLLGLECPPDREKLNYLSAGERAEIVNNPPLSLFLQFEAQQLGDDGATLGPLGSLIVAETIWAAFATDSWVDENDTLGRHEENLLGQHPQTMPQLIGVLREQAHQLFET